MKILIIGCGSIGVRHAQVITETGRHTLALCDFNRAFAEKLGAEVGVTEIYSDFNEAIEKSGADAVVVATPNHLHAAPSIKALECGMHVLCEKPIASSLEDAAAMVEAQKKSGKVLMVGFPMRSNRYLRKLKEVIRSGELGKMTSARVILAAPETLVAAKTPYRKKYETGGGIVFDYNHELDYCHYFFGPAKKCAAFVDLALPYLETCDDNADFIVKYASGMTVSYHMDYIQEKGATRGRSIAIVCEKGFIETNFSNMFNVFHNDGETDVYRFETVRNDMFFHQLGVFEAVCAGENVEYCSAQDAYDVLKLAHAVYESGREGKFVDL